MLDLKPGETEAQKETVARILDTGERLFRHYGYSKTTVADIAKELGMSTANIYRFFASKTEIHQAVCSRILSASIASAQLVAEMPLSAEERLRIYCETQYRMTVETMLDQEKVHEMVVIAIERDWHVIEKYIDELDLVVERIIADGIAAGEFPSQDVKLATRCFGSSLVILHHPMMVAQCLNKTNQVTPRQLIDFAIRALKTA